MWRSNAESTRFILRPWNLLVATGLNGARGACIRRDSIPHLAYAWRGMESLRIQAPRAPFSPVATNKFHGRRMKRVLSAFERHIERLAVAVSERHVEAKVIFGQ